MLEQCGFEFSRSDAEALVLDHLLFAIDDEEVIVLVDPSDVACVEPALSENASGFFGRVPVAAHDLRSAYSDLADFARYQCSRAVLEVNDAVLCVRHGHATAPNLDSGGLERA